MMIHHNFPDISFILATDRSHELYADKVIQSVRELNNPEEFTYEIIVVSPDRMVGDGIRWIPDHDPLTGGCHAYNLAYHGSSGDTIIGLVDTVALHPDTLELVKVLKSEAWTNRKFKIITMFPPGSTGGVDVINISPVPNYPRVGHIIISRETVENELNGWLLNPSFHHGAVDQYMGLWVYIHGEPAVWDTTYQMRFVDVDLNHANKPHCDSFDSEDRATMVRLYNEIMSGQRTVYAP